MTNKPPMIRTMLLACMIFTTLTATATEIRGAGSSAAAPLYQAWANDWAAKSKVKVTYTASGSSAGLKALKDGQVDFGASDAALPPADLEKDGLIQFPVAISGIVPIVNLPGIKPGALRLSGEVLADILTGRLKQWNARPISLLNPGLTLPASPITIVAREDGSGTTFNLSHYLAKVSTHFAKDVGIGFSVKWPADAKLVKGTTSMLDAVMAQTGTIGYAEYGQVEAHKMNYVRIANRKGEYPSPGPESFKAALASSGWTNSGAFEEMLTDMPLTGSWPITAGTFIITRKLHKNPEQAASILSLFSYGFLKGDAIAAKHHWTPLPPVTQGRVVREMGLVRDMAGQSITWNMNFLN